MPVTYNETAKEGFLCMSSTEKNITIICKDGCKTSWTSAGGKVYKINTEECYMYGEGGFTCTQGLCMSGFDVSLEEKVLVDGSNKTLYYHYCCCTGDLCNSKENLKTVSTEAAASTRPFATHHFPPYNLPAALDMHKAHADFTSTETSSTTIEIVACAFGFLLLCAVIGIGLYRKGYHKRHKFSSQLEVVQQLLSRKPKHRTATSKKNSSLLLSVSSESDSDKVSRSTTISEHLDEMFDLNINYNHLEGKGKFGLIYPAFDLKTLKRYCVKVSTAHFKSKCATENEAEVLRMLSPFNHKNIIKYFGMLQHTTGFILEFCTQGSLRDYLHKNVVDKKQCLSFARDLSSAISFLHSYDVSTPHKKSVAHRDICSANTLLREELKLVVADFGASEILDESNANNCTCDAEHLRVEGTPFYAAPEILSLSIDLAYVSAALKQADVYSMSLVLWEISNRCSFFYDKDTAIPNHTLPYESDVFDTEELIDHVVARKKRPEFFFLRGSNLTKFCQMEPSKEAFAKVFITVITQCWDCDEDARLSASCVYDKIEALASREDELLLLETVV